MGAERSMGTEVGGSVGEAEGEDVCGEQGGGGELVARGGPKGGEKGKWAG